MARKPRDPLLVKTERLLGNLMDMAIKQSSSRGEPLTEPVASDGPRMTVSEMRGVLQTSIAWQQFKDKVAPPEEEEPSEFEGLLHDLHGGKTRTRRRDRPESGDAASANGIAADASGLAGDH